LTLYVNASYNAIKEALPQRADALLDEVLPIVRELEDPLAMVVPWGNIGLAALLQGQPDRAQTAFENQLRLCGEHQQTSFISEPLGGLAAVAAGRRLPERAAQLLGAATSYGPVGDADVMAQLEQRFFMPARKLLGEEDWRAAERRGASLSLEETIAMALNAATAAPYRREPRAP
jgi:hypothetical protein